MHIQAPQIHDTAQRAKVADKTTVLSGASVSGAPELYPEFYYLHIGEIGDGTDRLLACLANSVAPPPAQIRPRPRSGCGVATWCYDSHRRERHRPLEIISMWTEVTNDEIQRHLSVEEAAIGSGEPCYSNEVVDTTARSSDVAK
jgi:hypothetical protein